MCDLHNSERRHLHSIQLYETYSYYISHLEWIYVHVVTFIFYSHRFCYSVLRYLHSMTIVYDLLFTILQPRLKISSWNGSCTGLTKTIFTTLNEDAYITWQSYVRLATSLLLRKTLSTWHDNFVTFLHQLSFCHHTLQLKMKLSKLRIQQKDLWRVSGCVFHMIC